MGVKVGTDVRLNYHALTLESRTQLKQSLEFYSGIAHKEEFQNHLQIHRHGSVRWGGRTSIGGWHLAKVASADVNWNGQSHEHAPGRPERLK